MDDLFDILIESGGKKVHTDSTDKNIVLSVSTLKIFWTQETAEETSVQAAVFSVF